MGRLLREIPQVSKLMEHFRGVYPVEIVKRAVREVTQEYRKEIIEGRRDRTDTLLKDIEIRIKELLSTNLRRVINATGIVINTNLGRAPLHREVLALVREIGESYSNLEHNLKEGQRGSRNAHVEEILCELTGAEAAFVVNNIAGAVYLVLNTLAAGREVIVSRGELVEIGGSFRIPDIMRASGAVLREVGTTNKTRVKDYEEVIGENTALIMKVHRSNFYMEGFVQEVGLEEVSRLGKKYGVSTYYDAGSGLLISVREIGINSEELSFGECLRKGIDIVSGSGDKLLGGPQAGIILGRREMLEKIKRNPMARALRIDKLTLSALEGTLRLYLEGRHREIPVIRMLSQTERVLKNRARRLARRLKSFNGLEVAVLRDTAKPGGGSIPEVELPTYCVAVRHAKLNAETLARELRLCEPPVVGRIKKDTLLLDMRTVSDEELKDIQKAFTSIL